MGREHTQNQGDSSHKRMGGNPGTFSPDDDEAQEADRSTIYDEPNDEQGTERQAQDGGGSQDQSQGQRGTRQAQGDAAGQPEGDVEQIDDDDADEDDEDDDEVNSISQ